MQQLRSVLLNCLVSKNKPNREVLLGLALNWKSIVGEKIAQLVTPYDYKLGKERAVLTVTVGPGQETMASYCLTEITEQVKIYTGLFIPLQIRIISSRKITLV